MRHHTKDKGDLAVARVIVDLARAGIRVCLPLSEHLPFDLVAVSPSLGALRRVQVKYAALRDGCVKIPMRSSHADRHGVHHRRVRLDEFDAFAVYCPQTDTVYYVRWDEIPGTLSCSLTLRAVRARNGQVKKMRWAGDFVGSARIFGPVAQMDRAAAF
jgi:hypothetical protein